MPTLFDPLQLGAITLKNRIVMAPLTRSRAGESRLPNALMAEYYGQRAGAGLILTEATAVSPQGVGYAGTPGIWNDDQIAGWRAITRAVHDKGGLIAMQLWHVGRISDPVFLNGQSPVAPSAVQPAGQVSLLRPRRDYVTPRALELEEIPGIVEAYRAAAHRARAAGFDGVELHGANGYLIDQFLQDRTNLRDDDYGGSIEGRTRLLREVIDALIDVWGADRVGLHLAPRGDSHDIGDSDPRALFTEVARQMADRSLAYLFLREYAGPDSVFADVRRTFGGPVIANERLTLDLAARLVAEGDADAVSFGRAYIANPDLSERILRGLPLNPLVDETIYGEGAQGYTDYPAATGVGPEAAEAAPA